jgi:hypothetical protein
MEIIIIIITDYKNIKQIKNRNMETKHINRIK